MKKRFLLLFLLGCLLLSSTAMATSKHSAPFVRTKTYNGEFSDLTTDSVFYDNVSALFEYGLSVGKLDSTYGMADNMTVGQAVIFAGRIRSLYRTGEAEAGAAAYKTETQTLAAEPYLRYLQAEGILGTELDENLTDLVTRAQMAHILANVLPEEVLPPINSDTVSQHYATRRFISDVTEYTPYYYDILKLYRQGVSQGSDASGSFFPDAYITRGAAAAMLTRMMDPALRITLTWGSNSIPPVAGHSLADLIPRGSYIAAPATTEDLLRSLQHMLSSNSNQLTLQYDSLTTEQAQQIVNSSIQLIKSYCEQCYNIVSCTYTLEGKMTLTFSLSGAQEDPSFYRDASMAAAITVHDQLWAKGFLVPGMTQLEIARVYYDWVCQNSVYDQEAGDGSLSHTAYNLFEKGLAVCDGYTGAYNLLLKLEGILCHTQSTDSHIWTVAELDGTLYHIDTTWGDSDESAINYLYFAMTPEQSALYHNTQIAA